MTKTINGSTNNQYWTYKLVVTETATDSVNRTSTIKVEHFLGRKSGSGSSYFQGNLTFKTTIGGTTQTTNKYLNSGTISAGGWKSIGSHTFTVPNTGTPTTISVSGTQTSSEFSPSKSTAEGTMDLTILHILPVINSVSMTETNSSLTGIGVPHTTIVNILSTKSIVVNYSLDNTTLKRINIYDASGYLIGTTTSGTTTSATVSCSFANNNVTSGLITVEVIDAVDSVGRYQNTYAFIPYAKPSLVDTSSGVQRKTTSTIGITDGYANLNIVGNYYYNTGNVVGTHTSITKVEYKCWRNNTTEPDYSNITSSVSRSGGNISLSNYQLTGIDYTYTYNYKIKITDNWGKTYEKANGKVPTGLAVWTEYDDFVDFYDITKKGVDLVDHNEMYYKANDIVELGSTIAGNMRGATGYVSSSTEKLYLDFITPKRLDNISTITVNNINVEARGNSGYLNSESGMHEFVGRSGYTITADKSSQNSIKVIITKSSAFTNVSNNTLVDLTGYFKFTMH